MATAVETRREEALCHTLPVDLWQDLAAHVRAYNPDVVVLVARKMPRIREALGLDFGSGAFEITDLAIPFCHSALYRSRVAIVDDVINRGTTVENARQQVMACGARDVAFFALAKTERAHLPESDLYCARQIPLRDGELRDLASKVPDALRIVNKPFDLGFPVIPCSFAVPFRTCTDIHAWLLRTFGPDVVHNPTAPLGYDHQLRRFSVDLGIGKPGLRKIRLYLDETTSECNLVPFDVPSVLSSDKRGLRRPEALSLDALLREALAQAPSGATLWPDEASTRARLFVGSLELGIEALDALQEVLVAREPGLFSASDAGWAFGPVIARTRYANEGDGVCEPGLTDVEDVSVSPFLSRCQEFEHGLFLENIRKRIPDGLGLVATEMLFDAFFLELSRLVGATNHDEYALSWPYTIEQVRENPYLRLRIGPTFDDLVALLSTMLPSSVETRSLRSVMSDMLDRFIDEGVVVPTIASYDGKLYRVYRKGENDHRDKAVQRTLLALDHLGRPISRTRMAKILTILTYSSRVDTCLVPSAEARGNVSMLQPDLLSQEEAELTRYLRDTGYIKRARAQEEGRDA